jgi:hypothetical protein
VGFASNVGMKDMASFPPLFLASAAKFLHYPGESMTTSLNRFQHAIGLPFQILLLVCIQGSAALLAQSNLVSNPSFESGLTGYWSGVWTGQAQIGVVSSQAHSGTNCLEIAGTNASATVWQNFSVPTNQAATVSLWVRPVGLSGPGITGLEIKSSGTFYYLSPDQQSNPGQWRQISVSFNTGNATNLTVICAFEMYGNGTGTAFFDDLSLSIEGVTLPPPMTLSAGANAAAKPGFSLNGSNIFPVILTRDTPLPYPPELRQYKSNGVDAVLITVPSANAAGGSLGDYLRNCQMAGMPVIIDFYPSFWNGWLQAAPERNLQLGANYPGTNTFVQYYPDFSRPDVQAYMSNDVATLVQALRPFHHNPIVAYSIGAYDYYHLPDGETHALWQTAAHNVADGLETWLPSGSNVTLDFQAFLTNNSVSAASIGFPSLSSVTTPASLSSAANSEHWRWWLLYRRFFVSRYIALVTGAFRGLCDLPITGSFDLGGSINENWATPVRDYCSPFDFLFLYWDANVTPIGQDSVAISNGVPAFLQLAQTELAGRRIPSIGLMNFNTAIYPSTNPPNSLDELDFSLPFVGGFFGWEEGYNSNFVGRTAAFKASGQWTQGPPPAQTAVLVSENDVMNRERGFLAGLFLQECGIPYDILYGTNDLSTYTNLYVLPDQPAFTADAAAQSAVRAFTAGGGNLPGSLYQQFTSPFTAFDFEQGDSVNACWIGGSGLGSLLVTGDAARPRHGNYDLRWSYSLPPSPAGNVPTFDLGTLDWNLTGLKKIGLWCYLDCSGVKTGQVMAMDLIRYHSGQPSTSLGYWNAGSQGLPGGQWVWLEWAVPTNQDMTDVDYVRLSYDAGNGWQSIARNGTNVTMYLDDVAFFFDNTNGGLSLNASVSSNGTQTAVSWPGFASLFNLQSTTNLQAGAVWTAVTNAPIWTNRQMRISLPIGSSPRFFRLSYP